MKRLPNNFELDRYGVHCRLVNEEDAAFITELRSDPRLSRFIHESDGDVQKQIEWIREYKKREANALDYYFIFSKDGEYFGLDRIYNIDWTHLTYTSGSWVMRNGLSPALAMVSSIILEDIAIEFLGLLVDIFDVRKDNKQVLNFNRNITKAIEYGETEDNILFMSTPDSKKNSRLRKLLDLV